MKRLVPTLLADDMERTIAFYRDVLGFELRDAQPAGGPYAWAALRCGQVELMLQLRSSFLVEREWDFFQGVPLGGTFILYIEMEGVDTFYERIKDQVDTVFPPADQPYGMREFTMRDCNGYALAFGQRL